MEATAVQLRNAYQHWTEYAKVIPKSPQRYLFTHIISDLLCVP